MRLFTKLFDEIDSTTSTLEKVAALKRYFAIAPPEDAIWAVLIMTGRLSKRQITSRSLRVSFQSITQYPEWLFEESYAQVGDSAETISLLLSSLDIAQENPDPSLEKSLSYWMEEEIPRISKIKDDQERSIELMQHWSKMSPDEIFILNKLITGGFRVGVSEKLVIRALAETFEIPSDNVAHRLSGGIESTREAFEQLVSKDEIENLGSKPYPFCLAHAWNERAESGFVASDWQIEWKFDGIRSQIIKRDGGLWIWSRGEEEISRSYPDLVEQFINLPEGSVIDGELLVIKDGQVQSFQTLQKRLGRKKIDKKLAEELPVGFIAYDCLEFGGEDLRSQSLVERRQFLEKLMKPLISSKIWISPTLEVSDLEGLEKLRAESRVHEAEGLMLKAKQSPYSVGRKTGNWWKHKVDPLTLDAVLIYAQAGSGRRANLYTDYTFALWRKDGEPEELVPFAKAYSGLDQSEINELDRWIRGHTKEKFGPVRSVEPAQVFEIGFEGIAKSSRHKSGIAVRFPRILRWRKDKKPEDADTLKSASDLLDAPEAI